MKLVFQTEFSSASCKICEKIATKCRRRDAELARIRRWREDGGAMKASIERSQDAVKELEQEIRQLEYERQVKQRSLNTA